MKLEPPDTHYFSAAQGWLGLGNAREAALELECLREEAREQPAVLEVRWQVGAAAGKWEDCLAIATTLVLKAPHHSRGWAHRSVSLYRLQRTEEALAALQPALELFPQDWVVRYDLACYACQLGMAPLARAWLTEALRLGDPRHIKRMALEDPDLESLWP